MSRSNLIKGIVFALAILISIPSDVAGRGGSSGGSRSSSFSSSRSSSSKSSFSSRPSSPPPASKPSTPPSGPTTSRNTNSATSIGNKPSTTSPASNPIPAKSAPDAGLTSRNNKTAATIGSKTVSAKTASNPAVKLSSADQKMVETMKKSGVKTASRDEAKTALLKKDPSLASPQTVSSKYNTFTSKPTSAPSYMPESTAYNGTTYVRVVYQDPISGSYSYRYRDPLGTMIDAYMIASIADSMTDYAMARNGIYYPNSYYAPTVVYRSSSSLVYTVFSFIFIFGAILILVAFYSSRKS